MINDNIQKLPEEDEAPLTMQSEVEQKVTEQQFDAQSLPTEGERTKVDVSSSVDASTTVAASKDEERSTRFTLLKAIAIICVVMSHAGIRGWLFDFVFIFHVPIFFMCAGYFFHTKYLTDERTFVLHRFKGLYWPFLRWSV